MSMFTFFVFVLNYYNKWLYITMQYFILLIYKTLKDWIINYFRDLWKIWEIPLRVATIRAIDKANEQLAHTMKGWQNLPDNSEQDSWNMIWTSRHATNRE